MQLRHLHNLYYCQFRGVDPCNKLLKGLLRLVNHPAMTVAELMPRLPGDRFTADPTTPGLGKGQVTPAKN